MKYSTYLLVLVILIILIFSRAHPEKKIVSIGFIVKYSEGWKAYTTFYDDLNVSGTHISTSNDTIVHLTSDTASNLLWDALLHKCECLKNLDSIDFEPDPDPIYVLNISYSDGTKLHFEKPLNSSYENKCLNELSELMSKNERIYNHQEGKGWTTK